MSTETLTYNAALEKFPFLQNLKLQNLYLNIEVEVEDYHKFILRQPQTLEDHTMHCGFQEHDLFVLGEQGELEKIDIRFGESIIYRARNMTLEEQPDDVDTQGETIAQAIAKYNATFKFIILHSWGHQRFGKDYETIIIAPRPD